jgi:hypothetical protein
MEDIKMATASNLRVLRIIPLLITIYLCSLPAYAKYSGGTGEPNNPYQIATAEDLMLLGETPEDYDKHFILTADIDLEPNLPGRKVFDRAVIAPDTGPTDDWGSFHGAPFTGVFDGNGHTILHLTIVGKDYLGLFGRLGSYDAPGGSGEAKNLGIVDVNIAASGNHDYIGGLVGYNNGNVMWCYSSGAVRGNYAVGGLVGGAYEGMVTHCYSTAAISGNNCVGGLLGAYAIEDDGIISRCYSTGRVSGNSCVGGLIGCNGPGPLVVESGSDGGPVTECYSTGAVSGTSFVGGLVGYDRWPDDVTDSFWDIQTSGQATSAGGTGKTTMEMRDPNTFTVARWDLVGEIVNGAHEVWQMPQGGGYPVLAILKGYTPCQLMGLGTPENPYLISDALDLGAIHYYNPKAHYRLVADIDLAGIRWTVAVIPSLGGTFDGHKHTISHLTIETLPRYGSSGRPTGLFGRLVSEAEVRDLGVTDANIIGSDARIGVLVGSSGSWDSPGGSVSGCYSTGRISGGWDVGGLVGYNVGSVTTSYSIVSTCGGWMVGGLVGYNEGSVTTSYGIGEVTGFESAGGLVGGNYGSIATSYSSGSVSGTYEISGLVGSNAGRITSSYSSGTVAGKESMGGLVAKSIGTVLHCVWDIEASGQLGSAGGVGLTTTEMMNPYMLGLNGFASDPNWVLDVGHDYPRLAWEGKPGTIIPVPHVDWLTGRGNPEDPYRIDTAEQLILLGKASILWDKHFIVLADIDLDPSLPSGQVFGQALIPRFTGSFDGNGHTISNLTVTGADMLGLFGRLEYGAEIKNLGIVDVNMTGSGGFVGGLVGSSQSASVTNCYSEGVVSGTGGAMGGLVGRNEGTLSQSYSAASVSGAGRGVGGLVGSNGGSVTMTYSSGSVSIDGFEVGGLVGRNSGTVSNSYSTGAVSGYIPIAGLVGYNTGVVSNSYSTGVAKNPSTERVAYGLVGKEWWGVKSIGTVTQCFWDTQTSGQMTSAGGTGKTTAEMQMAKTFLDAGWDFVDETANGTEDIWWILEGQDYPRLWWEAVEQ